MAPTKRTVSVSDDGRYVMVDGRRWRATDPSIPEDLRTELVGELMSARRAVATADSDVATASARRRVHDAKVALGERGRAWWEPADEAAQRARIEASARTLLRRRGAAASVCPSEIARITGGAEWRTVMDAVRQTLTALGASGEIEIRPGHDVVDTAGRPGGPIRIARGPRFDVQTRT